MIAYMKGLIQDISEDNLILEVHDIGYNIKISGETARLLPGIGEEAKIYTYTHVKEDAFLLFGFLTRDDLEIFKKVITVSGIGPKGGLAILSVMSADELRFAILAGDSKAIARAPGVGAKTAERLILDLRDKISIEDSFMGGNALTGVEATETGSAKSEAAEALVSLGYGAAEALKAIKKLDITEDMDTEAILKAALRHMTY